jgi:hypothetical protein
VAAALAHEARVARVQGRRAWLRRNRELARSGRAPRGPWGGAAPETLTMPSGETLRAQGQPALDFAIRRLHGGYLAVADRMGLLAPPPRTARASPKDTLEAPHGASKRLRPRSAHATAAAEEAAIPPRADARYYADFRHVKARQPPAFPPVLGGHVSSLPPY